MKKTALITGASSGIGAELARIHAQKGGNLILVARSEDKLKALKQELEQKHKVQVNCIVQDLSEIGAGEQVYRAVKAANLTVDYLINNAGFGLVGEFHTLPWPRQHQMIQLNITALTELTYLFLPEFVQRNTGRILNTSSTASLLPGPLQAVYYATKAYVTSFSLAVAEELHNKNVTVTALLPGATETDFGKVSGMDKTSLFDKTASAYSVAKAGYEAMCAGKLQVVSGLTFSQKILMKIQPFVPKKMLLSQIRKMQTVK